MCLSALANLTWQSRTQDEHPKTMFSKDKVRLLEELSQTKVSYDVAEEQVQTNMGSVTFRLVLLTAVDRIYFFFNRILSHLLINTGSVWQQDRGLGKWLGLIILSKPWYVIGVKFTGDFLWVIQLPDIHLWGLDLELNAEDSSASSCSCLCSWYW